MTSPTNYPDFPMTETCALFTTLSGVTFLDEDDPISLDDIRGSVSLVADSPVGIDQKNTSSTTQSNTSLQSQISISNITLGLRVESNTSPKQARDALRAIRTKLSGDYETGNDLRSRNTSFVDVGPIRAYRMTADQHAVHVAQMDVMLLWTTVATPVDVGSIDHMTITGTPKDALGNVAETIISSD